MVFLFIFLYKWGNYTLAIGKKRKHILIISEEPRILAEIKSELMENFDISIAATGKAAITAMESYDMSAIVIYICEKHEKAFSVFAEICHFCKSKHIPVIFLSEKYNDEDELTAFTVGAADYSVRRKEAVKAFSSRLQYRILIGECEKRLMNGDYSLHFGDNAPEKVLVNKTILVADDVELNRDIIAAMLSEIEGLTIEFAANGKEAVEKFEKDPNLYSLILMDVQMPVMDGLEATKTIRHLSCENARDIPIIAATADAEEKEIKLCLDAGMNDFLEKPIVYDIFLSAVAEHCITNTGSTS